MELKEHNWDALLEDTGAVQVVACPYGAMARGLFLQSIEKLLGYPEFWSFMRYKYHGDYEGPPRNYDINPPYDLYVRQPEYDFIKSNMVMAYGRFVTTELDGIAYVINGNIYIDNSIKEGLAFLISDNNAEPIPMIVLTFTEYNE